MGRLAKITLPALSSKTPVDALARGGHRWCMQVNAHLAEEHRATLIQAIAATQDRAAFIALFEYYAPRIKSQAMRYGLPADTAEDVAQDAMLSVWTRASQFNPERGAASAWVFTIATHVRIDRLRRERRRMTEAEPEPIDTATPESCLVQSDEADIISAALTELNAEQRAIVEMSFYQDTPHAAIASRLGIPLGTVKSRVRLALKRLKTVLGDRT